MPHIISDEMHSEVAFALSCYLDDLERTIKKEEKRLPNRLIAARAQHAKLQRWLLKEFNPKALVGELELMDGTKIQP